MKKTKSLTYILISLSVIFWGISFILTKELFLTEEHMTVTILIALRLGIATLVMLPTMALTRQLEPIRKGPGKGLTALMRGDLKWFLLLALCEPFIYHLCETSGVQLVSGSLASVVIATIPLFVPFGMWVAYRQRITPQLIVGVVLSLGGVFILIAGGESLQGNAKGLLFLAGAVVIAVVYTLLLVNAFDGSHLPLLSYSPKMLLILLTLGICCSTLAYAFYNRGVRVLGASEACIFNNAIPVFSLIAAVAIGQEVFSWSKVIGMAIVIAGVIIAQNPLRGNRTP